MTLIISFVKIAIYLALFVGSLALIRRIFAEEGESLLSLLKRGSILEFTSRPGALSFMTFVVICALGLMLASSSELLGIVYDLFNVKPTDRGFTANEALAYAMCALILNFIFVTWMRPRRRR